MTPDGRVTRVLVSRRRFVGGALAVGSGALWTPPLVTAVATPAAASSNGAGNGGGGTPKTPPLVATGLGYPLGLSMGPDGQVYVADFGSVDGTRDRPRSNPAGGSGQRNGTVAVLFSSTAYWPSDVSFDAAGNLYFTDYGWDGDDGGDQAHEGGRVVVVASGSIGSDAPVVTELATGLDDPSSLLVDPDGTVYVSDTGEADGRGDADPSGRVLGYPLTANPPPIAVGTPILVAGTGTAITGGAPLPVQPVPAGTLVSEVDVFVAFGLAGAGSVLYVADEYAHVVYAVDLPSATIKAYAGNGQATNLAGTGDGGSAIDAEVPFPQGLAVDGAGNLYILQIEGQVRRVDTHGTITTVSTGPYVSDNVGITFDPRTDSVYYISNDYPQPGQLHRVGL